MKGRRRRSLVSGRRGGTGQHTTCVGNTPQQEHDHHQLSEISFMVVGVGIGTSEILNWWRSTCQIQLLLDSMRDPEEVQSIP